MAFLRSATTPTEFAWAVSSLLEVYAAVFQWVLVLAAEKKMLPGKTVAVDATTLEADAAMKSTVRRDTGEDWNEYLRRLMKEREGVEDPTDEALRRFDKRRKDKRVSNDEWVSETDANSRITKMKDGTTHLAYKAEHVVDLKTELVLAASIRHADEGDADTMVDSVMEAQTNLSKAGIATEITEAVADKSYHAANTIELAESVNVRTYIPERKIKGKRNWQDLPEEKRQAVRKNHRRVQSARSKRLQRARSELVERSFAHMCDTGGARRSWLRGIEKVQKRYLIAAVARNLGLVMRKLFGIGTPRSLQAEGGLSAAVRFVCFHICNLSHRSYRVVASSRADLELCATAA